MLLIFTKLRMTNFYKNHSHLNHMNSKGIYKILKNSLSHYLYFIKFYSFINSTDESSSSISE